MKLFLLLINFVPLSYGVSILNPSNDVQIVVDIIKSYDKPTSVIAKVCWPMAKKLKITQQINMKSLTTIRFVNEETEVNDLITKDDILYLLDVNCTDNGAFLVQANVSKKFCRPYRWIILGNVMIDGNIIPELKDVNVLVDSEVIYVDQTENGKFIIKMLYKIAANGQWYTEFYGIWENTSGLSKSRDMDVSTPMRRRNLRSEPIATSIIISSNTTKNDLEDLRNILVDTLSKSTFRHIMPLYNFMNATRVLIYTGTWGYYANGSWDGMIGDLASHNAELGGCVAFITEQRLDVVDYLSHPTPIKPKFVFREPPLSYKNNLFLLPFKATVWYCTAAFVLILIIILYFNAQWEIWKAEKYQKTIDSTALRPSVSDVAIFVVSAISQQGSSNELKGTLGRAVMFILFLTFLFLYTSYSANIVALLQSSSNQIRTLSDLLNSNLELGVEDVAYNRHFFSTATEPIRKAIYETKVAPKGSKPNFMSIEEGVKRLQKKPFAFNMNIGMGYRIVERYFQEHEKCGLQEIDYIQGNDPWLCCRKNSPFKEIYKIGFFRIIEHGISDRENRLIYAKKPICSFRGGSFGSVDIIDFYPVLLLLLYGIILSFLLLIIKIFVHRRRIAR